MIQLKILLFSRSIKNITNCVYRVYTECSESGDNEVNGNEVNEFLKTKEFVDSSCNESSSIFQGKCFLLYHFIIKI